MLLPTRAFDKLTEPPAGTPEYVRYHAFIAVMGAAVDLARRNARESRRIREGQGYMLIGAFLIIVAVTVYLFTSKPEQPVSNDRPSGQAVVRWVSEA